MNYILFDDNTAENLLPFTYTRPVCEIRIGILTIKEKWENHLKTTASSLSKDYLSKKFTTKYGEQNVFINGSVCPANSLVETIKNLKVGDGVYTGTKLIAVNKGDLKDFDFNDPKVKNKLQINSDYLKIDNLWDIFSKNQQALADDFKLLTQGRKSKSISSSNKVINPENIFIEEGAKVECAILNASTGPIYIGKEAEIMEGSMVRGPFALCDHAVLKLGTKIYGATTVGPHSRVGGEVNNSVIFGYSNKAHDGFLGNSVIGEWCNLGADTNNSNLKNNYSEVKIWSCHQKKYINAGLQFCGLFMADHAKSAINTMFNTGTVVGVSANIFGAGFPEKFVPGFSWGGAQGIEKFEVAKAIEVAQRMYERRGLVFDNIEKEIFTRLYTDL